MGGLGNITPRMLKTLHTKETLLFLNTDSVKQPVFVWNHDPLTFCGVRLNGFKISS